MEQSVLTTTTSSASNTDTKKRALNENSSIETEQIPIINSNTPKEIDLSKCTLKLITKTKKHNIYRVSSDRSLKVLKTPIKSPTVQEIKNLINESKISNQLSYHGYRKSYAITSYENKTSLLLEWADGTPLSNENCNVTSFLKIAREIVSCVKSMHDNNTCHLNISSDHILYDSKSNGVKIIGLGKATSSSISFCNNTSYYPKLLEKDLRYVSPEQTGRINRHVIDYRSDFYR